MVPSPFLQREPVVNVGALDVYGALCAPGLMNSARQLAYQANVLSVEAIQSHVYFILPSCLFPEGMNLRFALLLNAVAVKQQSFGNLLYSLTSPRLSGVLIGQCHCGNIVCPGVWQHPVPRGSVGHHVVALPAALSARHAPAVSSAWYCLFW